MTGNGLAGYSMIERVLRGWDLSRATGHGTVIDSGLARAIYDEILPDVERLRQRGAFGPAVPVPGTLPPAIAWSCCSAAPRRRTLRIRRASTGLVALNDDCLTRPATVIVKLPI